MTLSPASTGAKSASLSIAHNASGSPSSVSLNGTGTVPNLQIAGKIAFYSLRDGDDYEIYTMNADGTNQRKLFDLDGPIDGTVSLAPDMSFGWGEERISWAP